MKRHVLMVKPRFVPQVLEGSKIHTVRPERKRRIEPGDLLDLRQWADKPYRSKHIKIAEKVCTGVQVIWISKSSVRISPYHPSLLKILSQDQTEEFSSNDGFLQFQDLIAFFLAMHGLPFVGNVIHWGNPSYLA